MRPTDAVKARIVIDYVQNRIAHIRQMCESCLERDPVGSDRYWLAEAVINILDGKIDDQQAK